MKKLVVDLDHYPKLVIEFLTLKPRVIHVNFFENPKVVDGVIEVFDIYGTRHSFSIQTLVTWRIVTKEIDEMWAKTLKEHPEQKE